MVLCQLCQSDTELGVSYAGHDVRGSGCIVTSVFGKEKNLAEKRWALSDASLRATERARCSNRPMLQRLLDSVSCSSRARLIEKRTPRQCKYSPAAARTLVPQLVNHASKGPSLELATSAAFAQLLGKSLADNGRRIKVSLRAVGETATI